MKYNDIDDTLRIYFKSLKNFKSLTKDEEQKLLKEYKENGNLRARDKIIESNLKYTCKIANRYRDKGVDFSELISEANEALIDAIDRFDVKRDVKIMSYAKWWIIQRMQSVIVNKGKFPLSEMPLGSFNSNINDDDEHITPYEDGDDSIENEDLIFEKTEKETDYESKKTFLKDITNVLDTRENDMVNMYYGISYDNEFTLEEIGLKFNLTKERVRQIIEKSFKKMRTKSLLIDEPYDL